MGMFRKMYEQSFSLCLVIFNGKSLRTSNLPERTNVTTQIQSINYSKFLILANKFPFFIFLLNRATINKILTCQFCQINSSYTIL